MGIVTSNTFSDLKTRYEGTTNDNTFSDTSKNQYADSDVRNGGNNEDVNVLSPLDTSEYEGRGGDSRFSFEASSQEVAVKKASGDVVSPMSNTTKNEYYNQGSGDIVDPISGELNTAQYDGAPDSNFVVIPNANQTAAVANINNVVRTSPMSERTKNKYHDANGEDVTTSPEYNPDYDRRDLKHTKFNGTQEVIIDENSIHDDIEKNDWNDRTTYGRDGAPIGGGYYDQYQMQVGWADPARTDRTVNSSTRRGQVTNFLGIGGEVIR